MTYAVRGNALQIPMVDKSVDLIVTSPPYFALRSYRDGDEHYAHQIGSEPTPKEFLEALWAAMAECWRVLKPEGSCWVNLGDKYAGSGGHNNSAISNKTTLDGGKRKLQDDASRRQLASRRNAPDSYNKAADVRAKSLMGLPWSFANGCTGAYPFEAGLAAPDGQTWILRAEVVWDKPNCLSGGMQVYAKVKGRPISIKVHDLCRAYQPDDVQLWNGERWTQVIWWQPTGRHPDADESYRAIRAARKRGDEPVVGGDIEIEFRNGERVGCTREHRWPTQRGLVYASDLIAGDIVQAARLPEGEATPTALDDEMVGWFVGLYIAEGSRSEGTIQIAGHVDELERYKRLQELATAFHGTCNVYTTATNTASINLSGRFLDAILETYVGGRIAKDKHLAPKAWQRSNAFLRAVLDGYLSGDGHYAANADRWILGFTTNDAWASDLRTLGARLGISVRLRRCTVTGFGKEWPAWGGSLIMNADRRRQADTEVVAIRQSRARRFWDIGVEDDPHLFALASGVLTHNSLPESVTDRVRRSHEQWFHFTKSPRYFSAVDEIREPQKEFITNGGNPKRGRGHGGNALEAGTFSKDGGFNAYRAERGIEYNPLGRLPGSVWTVPSEPLMIPDWERERWNLPDHFAAFPQEFPRRIILGWSPSGICQECGEGRRPVVDREYVRRQNNFEGRTERNSDNNRRDVDLPYGSSAISKNTITGYACACPDDSAPTRKSVILDPFGGTGTVAMVAKALGRTGVSLDLSADYCRLADWRINHSGHAKKAESRTWKERQGAML